GLTLRRPDREATPCRPATQLEPPADTVAARRMGMLDRGVDPERAGDRAPPTHRDALLGRGVDRHAVRRQRAGDLDVLVGGVRDHVRRFPGTPPPDELVPP